MTFPPPIALATIGGEDSPCVNRGFARLQRLPGVPAGNLTLSFKDGRAPHLPAERSSADLSRVSPAEAVRRLILSCQRPRPRL
jgi:hypothetical protein